VGYSYCMKILYTNFHEQCGGGHDTYIFTLCKALSSAHSIVVAAPENSLLLKKIATIAAVRTFPFNFQFRINKFVALYKKVLELRRFLLKEQFDVIHVNGSKDHSLVILSTILVPKKPRIIFTKHNSLPIKFGAKLRYSYFTDHVIAVSENTKQMFSSIKTPVTVVYNGVDINFFKPYDKALTLSLREKYGIKADDLVFGSVAGTALYKGWTLLLEAMAQLPTESLQGIKVIVAGDMPTLAERETYNQQYRLKNALILTGLISDVREVIAVMDVGFVLSYAVETISFACREMMAMGKPVIVSNYAGLPENVTDSVDGYIVESKNIDSIKKCIVKIMNKPQNLPIMGKNARRKAEESFSEQYFIENTLAVYTAEAGKLSNPTQ